MTCAQTSLMIKLSPTQLAGTLQGHLDEVAARLLGTLAERVEHNPRIQVILDVSEVGDLSPPGVTALHELQQLALASDSTLQLRGASASLQLELVAAGLGSLLPPSSSTPPDQAEGTPG